MKAFLSFLLISLALFSQGNPPHEATRCTFIIPPLTRFNAQEFIFTGRVTGFTTAPFTYTALVDDPTTKTLMVVEKDTVAWGVMVEPLEALNLPTPHNLYEVYPLGVDPMCESVPFSEEAVKKLQVGAKVVMFAWEGKLDKHRDTVQLIVSWDLLAEQAIPFASWPDEIAAQDDFVEQTRAAVERVITERKSRDEAYEWLHRLPEARRAYEMRRDLLRLEKATTEQDKVRILAKMRSYYGRYFFQSFEEPCLYRYLVKEHIEEEQSLAQLNERLVDLGWEPVAREQECQK